MINKILFITLSNFGDVILTLPVLDALGANYPDARITVMVGPRASEIFRNNPNIEELIIYDKYAALRKKIRLFFALKSTHFDIVIDLRNTLFGALLPVRFRTSPFLYIPSHIRHVKEQNLYRLKKALRYKKHLMGIEKKSLYINQEDKDYINALLEDNGITGDDPECSNLLRDASGCRRDTSKKDHIRHKTVIVSCAAGGKTRRWGKEKFIRLCRSLARDYSVILIGRKDDKALTQYIKANCKDEILDFAGLTNLA